MLVLPATAQHGVKGHLAGKFLQAEEDEHLLRCDARFTPPLSTRVDIAAYAKKIRDEAWTFEAWDRRGLAGLVAAYVDPGKRSCDITDVSVLAEHCGKGVATRLVGALVMVHSDDDGLVLPPKLAPKHVVLLPICRNDAERAQVLPYCESLQKELTDLVAVQPVPGGPVEPVAPTPAPALPQSRPSRRCGRATRSWRSPRAAG